MIFQKTVQFLPWYFSLNLHEDIWHWKSSFQRQQWANITLFVSGNQRLNTSALAELVIFLSVSNSMVVTSVFSSKFALLTGVRSVFLPSSHFWQVSHQFFFQVHTLVWCHISFFSFQYTCLGVKHLLEGMNSIGILTVVWQVDSWQLTHFRGVVVLPKKV